MVNILQHPILENFDCGSWESGGSGSFLWPVISGIVVLDGTHMTKRSHLFLSSKPTKASFVILADDVQRV
jgi:hypothetical protein